jgi:uncharacterized protein (TIGR02722 family)
MTTSKTAISLTSWGVLIGSLAAVSALPGCGPEVSRGSETAGLDNAAMSTGLDRKDLQRMLQVNIDSLNNSKVIARWEEENRPTVAVLSIKNETSEHIEGALNSLISDIETALIDTQVLSVIDAEQQPELIEQVRAQQGDAFDQSQVASWGQQLGARYFVTGKVYTVDERIDGERRVQYFLFMRVLEAATGAILWQNKTSETKLLSN